MRWVLPGGAELTEINRKGSERQVVCRPEAAVLVRTRRVPPPPADPPEEKTIEALFTVNTLAQAGQEKTAAVAGATTQVCGATLDGNDTGDQLAHTQSAKKSEVEATTTQGGGAPTPWWLPTLKQVLEVLTMLVALIGAILALFAGSRK